VRRRILTPAVGIFAAALLLSALVHLQGYLGLGFIKELMDRTRAVQAEPSWLELEVGGAPSETAAEAEPAEAEATDPAEPGEAVALDEPRRRPERRRAPARPEEEVEEEPEPEPETVVARAVPAPPPEAMNKQAIQQRSRDPSVEPPPDSRFIADESNRVEEETVARLRNFQRDDAEQSAGQQSASEAAELGNDDEEEIADARDMEGSDVRTPTEREASARRPREADDTPPPNVPARGDTGRTGAASSAGGGSAVASTGGDEGGAAASGGGEPAPRVLEVNDGHGTFVIALRPERPEGVGAGQGGGEARTGIGTGTAGEGARAGRPGRGRRGERGLGRGRSDNGPDLRVSWAQLEEIYSPEQLQEERERWLEERRSRLRGSNRNRQWREFRAAIENFVPNVRPGNQTALNAAASPFAGYIAGIHRRIHREYAHRFLRSLPAGGTSPFADRTLVAKLEIILNRDGSVHRIGMVRTSGFLPFDYGAFRAVMRAQPYPEPPRSILSGDGRVYLHWGFYRNERQCGTFNAEPFILPNPPGTPRRGGGPLSDELEQGGIVPRNAEPTWGTQGERGGAPTEGEESPGSEDDPGEAPRPAPGDGAPPAPREEPPPAEQGEPRRSPDPPREGGALIG